ncbi:MAG: helix-turn-helix transcriptional regulator [bacterium]|nr:helix-turn-helix transcriptional regulator [bacterium]
MDLSSANIGRFLKGRLKQLGLKQVEIARELGIDPSTYSKWIKGGAFPKNKHVRDQLFNILQITEEMLTEESISQLPVVTERPDTSHIDILLIKALAKTPLQQVSVSDLIFLNRLQAEMKKPLTRALIIALLNTRK